MADSKKTTEKLEVSDVSALTESNGKKKFRSTLDEPITRWYVKENLFKLKINYIFKFKVGSTKTLYVFGGTGTVSSGETLNINTRSKKWTVFTWSASGDGDLALPLDKGLGLLPFSHL